MATARNQRIGIWIIAIVLTIGTIGSFAVMVLANNNSVSDQEKQAAATAKYNKQVEEYQTKLEAQTKQLSDKYYPVFSKYESYPATFNKNDVKKLSTKDLTVGSGETIKDGTAYSAYYIGWNPKGKVFDQSISGKELKAPISGGNLIKGWNQGVVGMKMGGVRLLTIPASLAYGDQSPSADIPPNTPLKFIVMVIPPVQQIPQPQYDGATQ